MILNGMGWNPNNIFTYPTPTAFPTFCDIIETYLIDITEDSEPFDPADASAPLYF